MELLKVENLNFTYPAQNEKTLKDVSLSVKEGEFIVLCGESGCGKTTLLRLLKRELAPYGQKEGQIVYRGCEQEKLDEKISACEIGYVMQNPENQIVMDKVWHELAFGLENMGLPQQTIRRRVGEMACFFGIDEWFRKETAQLSGGQKQLLNLASIMAMQPKILILDEPTSQLDPIAAADFIATIGKLNRELGTTILMVEHRLEEVFPIADKVLVMEQGRILLCESPQAAGRRLKEIRGNHRMLVGFPSAVRIYHALDVPEAPCPVTVRDGREFLETYFSNQKQHRALHDNCQLDGKPAVVLKDVWFRYKRELPDVLEGVSLEVKTGEIVSILGGNGSGKTTLLSVISDMNHAYRGRIRILGKKLKAYRGNELYKHTLAMLPQNPQTVFIKESVREDYKEMQKVMEYSDSEMDRQVAEVEKLLGISALMDKHPYDLSGGEQQKAALGKVLLLQPKILLLDEPTKGIDAYSKHRLVGLMKKLQEGGMTILMVTHDVEFAAEVSNRCAMFFDRELTSVDPPAEFFCGNSFYTTAANRIARQMFDDVVVCEDIVSLCRINGRKEEEHEDKTINGDSAAGRLCGGAHLLRSHGVSGQAL